MRDAHGVAGRLAPAQYRFDRTRSAIYMPNTRAFPKNTEIEVTTTLTTEGGGGGGGGRAAPARGRSAGASATSRRRPRRSRCASTTRSSNCRTATTNHAGWDPRSGFFGVSYLDFSAPFGTDVRTRFINRHRLEKKDPNAAMSEPVKPITYYVDPGAPEPVRTALIEGARWWNQAFEAAGFRNGFRRRAAARGRRSDGRALQHHHVGASFDARLELRLVGHRSTDGGDHQGPRLARIVACAAGHLIGEGLLSPYTTGTEKPQVLTDMVVARLRQLSAHEVGHTIGLGHNYYDSTAGRISVHGLSASAGHAPSATARWTSRTSTRTASASGTRSR